jgi:hypothetical protein
MEDAINNMSNIFCIIVASITAIWSNNIHVVFITNIFFAAIVAQISNFVHKPRFCNPNWFAKRLKSFASKLLTKKLNVSTPLSS